jgi:NADPH:quinone reductase-like Zn-dependent oxidoreductase
LPRRSWPTVESETDKVHGQYIPGVEPQKRMSHTAACLALVRRGYLADTLLPMRAIVVTRLGGPEVLAVRDVPEPVVASGQVMVRVRAGGLNFADIMTAHGGYPGTPSPPFVAGREFAGIDETTARRVMGYTQWSAFAEKTAARPALLWPVPEKWSEEQAAAFPVNYFTAYFAYWEAGFLDQPSGSRRRRVLIHAVAGGVGTAAVQIGHILGAEMFGTSSSDDKLARTKELGLQHAINYKQHDYEQAIHDLTGGEGVDAVFEMLGGEHTAKSIRCLRDFGKVVQYGTATGKQPHLDLRALYAKAAMVQGLWLTYLSGKQDLMDQAWQQLSRWVNAGRLNPVVGHVLPAERASEAYQLLLERRNFGKVVLKIA